VILEEGLYVYNIHNIVDKYFSISIAPVQNQSGSLVCDKTVPCAPTNALNLIGQKVFKNTQSSLAITVNSTSDL
jgi:hypothetical protein